MHKNSYDTCGYILVHTSYQARYVRADVHTVHAEDTIQYILYIWYILCILYRTVPYFCRVLDGSLNETTHVEWFAICVPL